MACFTCEITNEKVCDSTCPMSGGAPGDYCGNCVGSEFSDGGYVIEEDCNFLDVT